MAAPGTIAHVLETAQALAAAREAAAWALAAQATAPPIDNATPVNATQGA